MYTTIIRLTQRRVVRYALVGGIGIPIHDAALALFLALMGTRLYPLALACAFEISTTVNFVLNQIYTYGEQTHLTWLDWFKRALTAQLTSLSALAIAYLIAAALVYGIHFNPFIASPIGIVCTFAYNFVVSRRFVYRPAPTDDAPTTHPAN